MILDNVAVGVVTFNRLELLKEVIAGLRNQTTKPKQIFVVNNSSTDGTEEWLNQQTDIISVKQPNTGSSGGQYTSIKTMYDAGYEYIWIMDDDVVPVPDCLEQLSKHFQEDRVVTPLRWAVTGEVFWNDTLKLNMTNPFRTLWEVVITQKDLENEKIPAQGITFEGPLFHRKLVDKIGFPDRKFFIIGDDTEYWLRSIKAGFERYVITNARLDRKLPVAENEHIFTWRHYYIIRNLFALDRLHGNFWVKWLRPWFYFVKWLIRGKNIKNIKTTSKAFIDGYFYKQEL